MRSRYSIENGLTKDCNDLKTQAAVNGQIAIAQLEVLLDIRDLLQDKEK